MDLFLMDAAEIDLSDKFYCDLNFKKGGISYVGLIVFGFIPCMDKGKEWSEFVLCGHCEEWNSSPYGRIKHISSKTILNYVLYSLLLNIGGKSMNSIEDQRLHRNERLSLNSAKLILNNYEMNELNEYNKISNIVSAGIIEYEVTSLSQITFNIKSKNYQDRIMDKAEYEIQRMFAFDVNELYADPRQEFNTNVRHILYIV